MSENNKQIKVGAIISYLTIIFNLIVTLLYTPWMVSKIGKSNYALFTLSTSLISIFLMDFGISSSVARFLAKYKAEGREDEIAKFLGVVYKLFLFISLLIFVVLFVIYFFINKIYNGLSVEEIAQFKELYIIVAGYSIVSFPFMPLDGILNSHEKFIQLKICGLVQKSVSILLIVLALTLGFGVVAVVSANAVSGIIAILTKIVIIRKAGIPNPDFKTKDKKIFKDIFSFSVWVTIMSIAQRCMFNLAPSILGIVSNSDEIAVFSPANSLESYFFVFASAINGLFLPKISRLIANNERDQIMDLMIKVGKYQMIVLGLIFVGFCAIGKDFMVLWMGEDYIKSYYGAILIFIPDILIFSQQIANTLMIAENKVNLQAIGYIIMAVICLGASFVLSGLYGCVGACMAIAIGYIANFIYINIVYKKAIHLDMKAFYEKCYLRTIPILIVSIGLLFIIFHFIPQVSWMWLIIKGVIVVAVYLLLSLIFSITKTEKEFIKRKIFKRG